MTGSAKEEIEWLMGSDEIDGWLFKPFTLDDLKRLITSLGFSEASSSRRRAG
jgi:hypothetical protein